MKHREKLRMARRMRSTEEVRKNVSPFQCLAWEERKDNKQTRARNLEIRRHNSKLSDN